MVDDPEPEDDKLEEEDEQSVWAIIPVGVIAFFKGFIHFDTLSQAQTDVLEAIFGKEPDEKVFFNVGQAILRIGQGGGKNFMVTGLVTYAIYLWCCLRNPHKFFGQAIHEDFDILNFSQVTADQAKNVFFRALGAVLKLTKDPVTGENWFVKHMGMHISDYGKKSIKEDSLKIDNRRPGYGGISVYCLDSTAKSVEGYTIWMSILDEPSRANTPLLYAKAKKQYNTALTNMKTRFTDPHKRLMLAFSYPEQKVNDLLVELYNDHAAIKAENTHSITDNILTAWYDTYVFNPVDVEAKKEEYRKDHLKDPVDADRRWRAIVPPNVFGFFNPHIGKIEDCANPKLKLPVKYTVEVKPRMETVRGNLQEVLYRAIQLQEVTGDLKDRWWGADFAKTKDRLVLVGGYATKPTRSITEFDYHERTADGIEVKRTKTVNVRPVVDIIIVWEPAPGEPIDYQNVEDTLLDMIRSHFPNSHALHFDQWNTESIRVKLLDAGLKNCEMLSFGNPQQLLYGRMVRHLVWNNGIDYPDNPILKTEMSELILMNNTKLDHPDNGSKDIWDAFSICVNLIMTHAEATMGWDIQTGEGVDVVQDRYLRGRKYHEALKTFMAKHEGRGPRSHGEMINWFRLKYGELVSESDVEHMREEWIAMAEDIEERVLGMKEMARRNLGNERGTMDMSIDTVAAMEASMMGEESSHTVLQRMNVQGKQGRDDAEMTGKA